MANPEWVLKIIGDVSGMQKSLATMEQDLSGTKKAFGTAGKLIGGAFAADKVIDFGKALVGSASDQEQAIGAANSVFKEYSGSIQDFSKTTAENIGMSRQEFLQLSSVTGALIKGVGVPLDQTADSTKMLTSRAADMAAMFGGTTVEAMEAINSALKGERDPIEKYGVSLKQSAVDAKAAALGYVDAEGKVTDVGKTMATMQLIMDKTSDSAGTFAKESDTVAGSAQIMGAKWNDLQADLGKKLLPVIVKVTEAITALVGFVERNQSWLLPLAAGITAVVLAIKAWEIAQLALNLVLTANPIGLVVAAIAGVIAILVVMYTKVDWFRDFVDGAVKAVVDAWNWLWENMDTIGHYIMLGIKIWFWPFWLTYEALKALWNHFPEIFTAAVNGVKVALSTVWDVVSWPFKRAWDIVKGIIDQVSGWFDTVVRGVKNALNTVSDIVSWPFKEGARLARQAIDSITNLLDGIWQKVKNAFSGVTDIIQAPFKTAFDAIKKFWNNTIGGFGFSVPSWIPFAGGKSFKIPMMAKGGIITSPTIAMLGEAGPEAVVPLGKGGGFGNVTINVYALAAGAEVGRQVYNALREYERTSGNVFTGAA